MRPAHHIAVAPEKTGLRPRFLLLTSKSPCKDDWPTSSASDPRVRKLKQNRETRVDRIVIGVTTGLANLDMS